MALALKNYSGTGSINGDTINEVVLLIGASNGTIVKSLQIITGNESCHLKIKRKKNNSNIPYAVIEIELKANDYLLLWQGFFVISNGDILSFQADSNFCTLVANVVEMT